MENRKINMGEVKTVDMDRLMTVAVWVTVGLSAVSFIFSIVALILKLL